MNLTYAPIVVAPLPVTYDAWPNDRVPWSSPSEAPSQPKTRIRLKFEAQKCLEIEFGMNQYPTTARRKLLASQLAMPLIAITNWFHNKRSRLSRQNRISPKAMSAHPILMYRQMSSSSVWSHSMSSPGFSPQVTPLPAKRFRGWSVEAVPSPEGVSLSDVGYVCHSSLDSSSSQDISSLGSLSRDSPFVDGSFMDSSSYKDRCTSSSSSSQSVDCRSSYSLGTTTYTSHMSFSSGEISLEGDPRLPMAGPSAVRPVVIVPDVFSPAMDHLHPRESQTVTLGALPWEDAFHDQDTSHSPATPGEVFSPTLRIAQQALYADHNNNDQASPSWQTTGCVYSPGRWSCHPVSPQVRRPIPATHSSPGTHGPGHPHPLSRALPFHQQIAGCWSSSCPSPARDCQTHPVMTSRLPQPPV